MKYISCGVFLLLVGLLSQEIFAQESQEESHTSHEMSMGPNTLWQSAADCGPMSYWDISMMMCMPVAMPDMPMQMFMIRGNGFGTRTWQKPPRGRSSSFSTQMLMFDLGSSVSEHHYLNLDLMLTGELWSVPAQGYPLLLQIGEVDQSGNPYIDAQHPHSSPIMGVTLSDTITLNGNRDVLKLFFAPRGQSTDGPIAFMHRYTGLVNPNAPLGHHIGQDVGHISSTLLGASLKLGDQRFEVSGFSGREPSPTEVDLPLARPDSFAVRYMLDFTPQILGMISYANISSQHDHTSSLTRSHVEEIQGRYSFSLYTHSDLRQHWKWYSTWIYGGVSHYDETPFLSSFLGEVVLKNDNQRFWGRAEILQRTASELQIPNQLNSNDRQWVSALTLGFSHRLFFWEGWEGSFGGLVTVNFLPEAFQTSYGVNPVSLQAFFQIGGLHMWSLER